MLRVTVELIPNGNFEKRQTIAVAMTRDDGTNDSDTFVNSEYSFAYCDGSPGYEGRVENVRRGQDVWTYLRELLDHALR